MGLRRLALLALVAACPAKPASTTAVTERTPATSAPAVTADAGPGLAPAPTPAAPSGPASNATLAEVGLEATSLDRSADPCVDFYQFACGGWLGANPIPADRARWGRQEELAEKTLAQLQAILGEASKQTGDRLGDFYASCMDEAAIEKAGTAPIKALLAKAQGVKDAKTWQAAVVELHKTGIWVVWGAVAEAALDDATRYVTWIESAGLGLPDRDYYVNPTLADTLKGYTEHVQRMLALAGIAKPDAAAADVVAIETALATVTRTATQRTDVKSMNNPMDLKALGKRTKSVDWKGYFKGLGITPSTKITVASPTYFAALDGLRKQFKPAQWSRYFTYHLLARTAFGLPKAFDDELFTLTKLVQGVTEQKPRSKRCVESASTWLGELLGKQYVERHFPPASKQTAQQLFDAIVKAMSDEVGALEWLTPATRKNAQAKLAKLVAMIGYPEKWKSYDVVIERDDFAGNVLRAGTFETRRNLAKSGQPYDRGEWFANTFDVSAYYNLSANNTALLAGILQPPFFGANRSVAANMGGIGVVIGHELTHAFDNQGAHFDASGNLREWWTAEDRAAFVEKGKCVAEQYATFEVLPKQFINGQLTLGENIADLGGLKMAFRAYRALRTGAPPIVADGFTEDQIFFLAEAQKDCAKDRPAEAQRRLTVDPHAPKKFRVYGRLRNLPEFAQAFSCAAGTPMRPAQTCSVW